MKFVAVLALALFVFISFVFWSVHKDDDRLRAECEAAGGTFVEARSPMHVCVATIEQGRKAK